MTTTVHGGPKVSASKNFNAELHARPSIYFSGPSLVEHVALMPASTKTPGIAEVHLKSPSADDGTRVQVEHHTEFTTVTKVKPLKSPVQEWPQETNFPRDFDVSTPPFRLICRVSVLVLDAPPEDISPVLKRYGFGDTAASAIGGGAAQVCSDFLVGPGESSRILLFNGELNAYRLGRMVRRICEIETYRSMSLLGLPEARRLAPALKGFDETLTDLTNRHLNTPVEEHKKLLDEISTLSAHVISATAETRNRFGATAAYATIVEERIAELRESHVPGFQRFGVFVARRFKPAVRTCSATALRLEQLSHATMHLLDLLQTRIQVGIEYQNTVQIRAMAERAAVQLKIQRAVEGFSIIAISYYLLSLLKMTAETLDHAGLHLGPYTMLVSIPVVITAVALAVFRVRHALR
ncbi:DUF3422 domain-containing protein [Rhizobium leguminosarum]|uniref:DUF3422 domain-containing protein n=1 Tax=Rhizobium leguminosarum TaxID=384 RepID=UPI001C969D21|nr:DUF3422 domain-containing protein [Rhizobium leguminosarum]MBY5651723.1 DUF3422 domain-containing protein [Rhizobium leguminosarum]